MFCRNCGKELPENAAFCPECGSKQEMKEKKKLDLSFIQNLPQKTKLIAICAAAALGLVLIISLCFGGSNVNKSPETVAGAFYESVFEMDAEKMVDCLPDAFIRSLARNMNLSEDLSRDKIVDYLQEYLELQGNTIESEMGELLNVALDEYVDTDDLSRNGASKAEMSEITDAATVKVKLRIESEGTRTLYVTCVEIDDAWYIWDMD